MRMKLRAVVLLLAALLGAAGTARLGLWQLDRAAQKTALQAALQARAAMPALDLRALARQPDEVDQQLHRRVQLQGHWVAEHTVYLDNRQMNARVGFFVLTPLLLDDGTAVLVQRGWLARDFIDRAHVVAPPTPGGSVLVQGQLARSPSRLYEFEGTEHGSIRQNVDLESLARDTRLALRPLTVLQSTAAVDASGTSPAASMQTVDDGLLRDWPAPSAGVHKNRGYAFQWFALSALILGLYVWFRIVHPRLRRT